MLNLTDLLFKDFSKAFDTIPHKKVGILWCRKASSSLDLFWLLKRQQIENQL